MGVDWHFDGINRSSKAVTFHPWVKPRHGDQVNVVRTDAVTALKAFGSTANGELKSISTGGNNKWTSLRPLVRARSTSSGVPKVVGSDLGKIRVTLMHISVTTIGTLQRQMDGIVRI